MDAIRVTQFYKVIVINIGLFESKIEEEKHFGSVTEAAQYCDSINGKTDQMAVIVKM